MAKTWADMGIVLPSGASGELDVACPQCSGRRKKHNARCLSVNVDDGLYVCHHCGWSGSLKDGQRAASDPDPYGAPIRAKTWQPPRPMPAVVAPTTWQKAVTWFAGRGIPEAVLLRNGVMAIDEWCPVCEDRVGHLLFPAYRDGQHVNTKHRCGAKHFRMEKGAERVLYGLPDVAGETTIVLVEGEIDKLSCEVAGWPSTVSVPDGAPAPDATNYASKFAFLESAEAIFTAATSVILATDADAPGQALLEELARRIGREKCRRVTWPDGIKDANECLVSIGAAELDRCLREAEPYPIEGIVGVDDIGAELDALYEKGFDNGVPSGWSCFDRHYRTRVGLMTVVTGIAGHGKALAIDTPIPTPDGWTTMGEIAVGDWVFDERGYPCTVVGATEVMHDRSCYEVTFADRTKVVCDAGHEWMTRDDRAARSELMAKRHGRDTERAVLPKGTDQSHLRTFPSVKRTEDIAKTLNVRTATRTNHAVPVCHALQTAHADLPIAPYVLGAWLGDGDSHNGAITTPDREVIAEIEFAGYFVPKWAAKYRYGIRGLKVELARLGVLGNKHVPDVYLRASEAQRRALLQGLMDTDGSVTDYGRCEFTSINAALANAVRELAASLGYVPTLCVGRAKINGRDCGPKYRIMFTPFGQVFRLPRKQQRVKSEVTPRKRWRQIVACEPVDSVPVKCIQVDSPSHLYLCSHSMIPTHNSSFLDDLMVRLAIRHGWAFGICSPENQPIERHLAGILSAYMGKPFHDGPTPRMTATEVQSAKRWAADHFAFILPDEPTIDAILERAKALVYRMGIKALLVDPWNELEHSRPPTMSETEYISASLGKLRRFARHYRIHLWLVAHPTKMRRDEDGAEPVPGLWDVSGSAHFRNKADAGLSVWRDFKNPGDPVQVHILKIRFAETGEIGMVLFAYDRATGQYREIGLGA